MKPLSKVLITGTCLLLISSLISHLLPDKKVPDDPAAAGNPDEITIVMASEKDQKPQEEEEERKGDTILSLYDHRAKKLVRLPLEEYLVGVVAGEMSASFEEEALKAQAVAARTFAVWHMRSLGGRGCSQHKGADVCSSFAHCQEWLSKDRMRRNWGKNFELYHEKIRQAVQGTKGKTMLYDGKPIEVLYYSTSNGKTEEASEVFSRSLPYYRTVDSTGEEDAPHFKDSVACSNQKFAEIFQSKYGVRLDPDHLDKEIKINGYTESGRIRDLTIGGKTLRATEFRLLYQLNSTDITFVFGKDHITMKTKGFGHGVGMSQVGADRMARQGKDYQDILHHYYQGVEIHNY